MATTSKGETTGGDDDDGTQLTYNETIEALCGFVKTAVHTILCHRQVYPPNVFTRRQRYRVPVWASRHPGLNAYVDDVIEAVKVQIQRGLVRSIHMVITSTSSGAVLERYRFDIDFILSGIPMRDRDFSIPGNMTMQTMEMQLRAFMMKLISLDGALYDMNDPEDLTWALVLDMKEGCEPESSDARGNEPSQGMWVPFDEGRGRFDDGKNDLGTALSSELESSSDRPSYLRARPQWSGTSGEGSGQDDAQIVPIKSLDTGVINLLFYVEEHPKAKRQGGNDRKKDKGATAAAAASEEPTMRRRLKEKLNAEMVEAIQAGERDIDEPLPQPSSSGVAASRVRARRKQPKPAKVSEREGEEETDPSDSSDSELSGSGDSIRSVNDFAGYGKGPGSVGMSGVGM